MIAETIEHRFGGEFNFNGHFQHLMEDMNGTHIHDVCSDFAKKEECINSPGHQSIKYIFRDGSSIIITDRRHWRLGFESCWCHLDHGHLLTCELCNE